MHRGATREAQPPSGAFKRGLQTSNSRTHTWHMGMTCLHCEAQTGGSEPSRGWGGGDQLPAAGEWGFCSFGQETSIVH